MMRHRNDYRRQPAGGAKAFAQLSPGSVKACAERGAAGRKADLPGAKIREPSALAVAVTARCDGCIALHAAAAMRHGATREEIAEALGVAIAVNAGAALVYTTRGRDAVEDHAPAGAPLP